MGCDLMSTEYVCNERPEVVDTTVVNEESVCVRTKNDFGLIF